MRVLVCGSRVWDWYEPIDRFIAALPSDTVIIHGGARGADRFAGHAAALRGLSVEKYPADWDNLGYRAGPIRNQQMLDEAHPDLVVFFAHPDLERSAGTRDMVMRAVAAGLPVLEGYNFDD